MKKWIALLLAMLLTLPCAALAEDDWARTEALALARHLQKLAADEAFAAIISMPDSRAMAAELAEADFTEPAALWRLAVPGAQELYDMLQHVDANAVDDDFQALMAMSDPAFREVARRLPSAAISQAMSVALSGGADVAAWLRDQTRAV